ncbi:TPA: hypothetical protein MIO49_12145 [Klebsiella pneumoniae subsp. pneumoniae]|nr:hypothetical protein [Klebsiella pneumoniae subsp. pneumoniae]
MATTPIQTRQLLTVPFSAATDFTVLADYCDRFAEILIESDDPTLRLAQLLTGRVLLPKMERTLTGLLCELVWYFAADLKAPRWIRTADGVKFIDEVTA